MKIKKLLPTLGALSAIVVAAPIFGSCSEKEPIDEWIDATVDVDTTGFEKIEGQDLNVDEALKIYNKKISSDLSILANDIKWGSKTYFDFSKKDAGDDYVSAKILYKFSDSEFDLKTETVSFCFSLYLEWNTDIVPGGYEYQTRIYDLDIKINKIPLLFEEYGELGLIIAMDIMKTDSWSNESYINVEGSYTEGNVKNKVIESSLLYMYDDATINKENYDGYSFGAIINIYTAMRWPSYYFSDCNKD